LIVASGVIGVAAVWAGVCSAQAEERHNTDAVVRVESGLLRGIADEETVRFLGVPYAAPPVGQLRWAPPKAAASWGGVREAKKTASPAAQGPGELPNGSTSEDCLYLNITAPCRSANERPKPVMVWLHGGGFSSGTANTYDPRRMVVAGDVIVVTVEFRLNIFGFFGYKGVEGSGTFGFQDQQAALRWIKRNIAAFGGDPGNVILFGESGGAIAACAQLTSPGALGLFHKMILQSGAATTTWPRNAANLGPYGSFWRPLDEIEATGENLATEMGCPEPKGSLEALQWLRSRPTSELLAHSHKFGTAAHGGFVLPHHPGKALREGRFHAVPIVSGFTRDEGRGLALGMQLASGGKPMTEEDYRALLVKAFGDRVRQVEDRYPRSHYAAPALAWAAIYTDRMFACPQIAATRALARRAPTFAYEFADANAPGFFPFFPGFPPGASHSGELSFLFDVAGRPIDMTGKSVPLTAEQNALAATMIRYWTRFAQSGDPNGEGAPRWPRFDADAAAPLVQVLAPGPKGVESRDDVTAAHQCEFWATFLD
jgi:para-nitrobenzyl esterase